MKRFIVTEEEKREIFGLYQQIINEASEVMSSNQIMNDAKKELTNIGVNYEVLSPETIVDSDNPTCIPQTDDAEKNNIITRVWQWANNPENRGSLKETLVSLKNAIKNAKDIKDTTEANMTGNTQSMNEQVETALITIGGVALGPSALIAIGVILLFILVLVIVAGNKKNSPMCKRRRKLFKKHGIDGMFM